MTGSDDGSIDLWQYTPGMDASQPAQLHHLEGKAAHDNIVSRVDTLDLDPRYSGRHMLPLFEANLKQQFSGQRDCRGPHGQQGGQ